MYILIGSPVHYHLQNRANFLILNFIHCMIIVLINDLFAIVIVIVIVIAIAIVIVIVIDIEHELPHTAPIAVQYQTNF